MAARILITREEREGERALGEKRGLRLVFTPLTKVAFSASLRGDPPPTPPSDPSFHSESQRGVSSPTNIAFTSRNAVEALRAANLLHLLAHRTIWCVGPTTAAALGGIPHRISPGTTGEDLARFMIESGVTGDVLHICGEPHREELRATLERAECDVKEWVVYETVPVEAELPNLKIDAVAFFSPAAVRQFKALGWVESLRCPYVAIGPTTASELHPSSCVVSREASFRGVLETTRRILNVQL